MTYCTHLHTLVGFDILLITQITDMDHLKLTLLGSSNKSPKRLHQGWANPGGQVDRRLKFVRTRVIFVGTQYGNCFAKKKNYPFTDPVWLRGWVEV